MSNTKTSAPAPEMHNVKLSVKNARTISLTCDLSKLVDMSVQASDWYGEKAIKSANICKIPAQKLRVEGLEDVYVDMRVYVKSNAYEARAIRLEQEKAQAEAQSKLEAVRPAAEQIATALGITLEEAFKRLTGATA